MVTGRAIRGSDSITNLQRKHTGLQMRLAHLNRSCTALVTTADALLPAYAGETETQIRIRRDCVLHAVLELATIAEARASLLEEALNLHRFFATAQRLLAWLAEAKDRMSQPNDLR